MAITPTAQQQAVLASVQAMFGAATGANNLNVILPAVTTADPYGTAVKALAATDLWKTSLGYGSLDTTQTYQKFLLSLAGSMVSSANQAAVVTLMVANTGTGKAFATVNDGLAAIIKNLPTLTADATWGQVATQFNNKVSVSSYYTLDMTMNATSLAELQQITAGVSADPASVTAAMNSLNSIMLTVYTDIKSGSLFEAGQAYTPGGDDFVNTLQDVDKLTGTATDGTNTLNATVGNANDNGGAIITPSMTNMDIINAAFVGTGGAVGAVNAIDLQDTSGLETVNITRVSQVVNRAEMGNIQSVLTNMSVANSNANQAGTVEFSFGQNVLLGANTGAMALTNVQLLNLNVGMNATGIAASTVNTQGYETLNLSSAGAVNSISTLNLPMDTGTTGALNISGATNLTIGGAANIVNAANAALIEVAGLHTAATGIAQAGGRIAAVNAGSYTGNLTLVLDNILDVGKADTSGVRQNVTVTGGTGNDTFALYDAIEAGDSLNGGTGTDSLIMYAGTSIASVAGSIERLTMLANGANISADFDFLPDVTGVTVRNIGNNGATNVAAAAVQFNLTDMTTTQATGISIQHATTGNNQIANSQINAAVKTNTAADTLGITIAEGLNTDLRSNFTINTVIANNTSTIENVTLTDSDTESNLVELNSFAQHTGTITLTGGLAGTFLSLDVDTAGADVTGVTTGATVDGGQVQQGLLALDTTGTAVDYTAGNFVDVRNLATEVRLGAATINASAEASNVIVRVSTNAASAVGAQSITMGSGNDVVIFDNLNDTRAGLTISDTVAGGTGTDTLAIDGNGVRISLGASEWTNVSGFETLRLVGNGAAALGTMIGQNSYNLVLTNDMITANGNGLLAIVNDNDINNNTASAVDTTAPLVGTNAVSAVTIDARTLNSAMHFTYKGDEGAKRTTDKFIFADANINGGKTINGGAVDNLATTFAANADILEVRNTATVTAGDLNGISNIGIIAGSNDQAVAQTLVLQLNDTVLDAMVDSFHTASTTERETMTIRMNNAADIGAVAGAALDLDASQVTSKFILNVALDALNAGAAANVVDNVSLGYGNVTVTNFNVVAGATTDNLTVSGSLFGFGAGYATGKITATNADIQFAGVCTAATQRLSIRDVGGVATVFYDSDGNGAGTEVQILQLTGVTTAQVVAGTGLTIL